MNGSVTAITLSSTTVPIRKTIVKNILKEQNINDKEFSAPYLLSIISSCKEKAVTPEQYKADMEENFKTKIIYNVFPGL